MWVWNMLQELFERGSFNSPGVYVIHGNRIISLMIAIFMMYIF